MGKIKRKNRTSPQITTGLRSSQLVQMFKSNISHAKDFKLLAHLKFVLVLLNSGSNYTIPKNGLKAYGTTKILGI